MSKQETPSPAEPSRAFVPHRLLLGVLLAGAAVRLAYAATASGIFHPDEIFQSLEPAHGVVYGVGFRAWDSMGPLSPEARAFTSHALLCPDAHGRLAALPGFVESGRVGECRVLRAPGLRCDRAAAASFLAPVRW